MSETENTKAVILTQADGQKIFLDLNVSTDTTAIKSFEKGTELSIASFDYATGIAVFLALCATGLAYWYGQRSFKLTEMSFKTVIEQIKSSERIALTSNENLFISQQKIELIKKKLEGSLIQLNKLKQNIAAILIGTEQLNINIYKLNDDFFSNEVEYKELINKKERFEMDLNNITLQLKIIQLELIYDNNTEIELNDLLDKLRNELNWLFANCTLSQNKERHIKVDETLNKIEMVSKKILLSKGLN